MGIESIIDTEEKYMSNAKVFVLKKLGKIFGKKSLGECERVAIRSSVYQHIQFITCVYYRGDCITYNTNSYNYCKVKVANITDVISRIVINDVVNDIELRRYDLNRCIEFLLDQCGYREVLLPIDFYEVCEITELSYSNLGSVIVFKERV